MNGEYIPYIVTELFCIVFSVSILLRLRTGADEELRCLRDIIIAFIVMLASDILCVCIEHGMIRAIVWLDAIANGICLAAVVLGCYLWSRFVSVRLRQYAKPKKSILLLIAAPAAIACLLDILSSFTGWVFAIKADCSYDEGPMFWVQSVVCFVYLLLPMAYSVYMSFKTPLKEKRKEYLTYDAYIAITCGLVYFVDIVPQVPLFALSIFMGIQLLFITIYMDREYALAKKEREQTETSTAVMLSQLQPHFLFNALMAIQDKCHGKAPEAEEMVVEFAEYLRGNLDSLRRREPVPFRQELGHTKNYLALENKRFPGKIGVEYYIESEEFLIPSLTLQPVVENAVRYGITQREEGGTVRIYSKDTGKAYQVVVVDDGVGFDINATKPDGRTRIGIDSIRKRLGDMCGGSLEASSTPDVGTTVTITIPKMGGTAE
jgi:two-component system LytT family sensor kinase